MKEKYHMGKEFFLKLCDGLSAKSKKASSLNNIKHSFEDWACFLLKCYILLPGKLVSYWLSTAALVS